MSSWRAVKGQPGILPAAVPIPSENAHARPLFQGDVRSLLLGAPALIWPVFRATARSAIVVSSVSPERWDTTAAYPALWAILMASSVSDTVPI